MLKIRETKGGSNVLRNIERYAEITGRSIFQELQTTARSLCVALARGTLPRGLTKDVHQKQKARIRREISETLLGDSQMYAEIDSTDPLLAGEFWHAVKLGDEPRALDAIRTAGIHIPHTSQPAENSHWSKNKTYITNAKSREAYIRKIEARAGKAKAGWAKASDEASGIHRGIPLWASGRRHPDAAGGATVRNNPRNPEIVIMNRVSYIEEAMIGTSVYRTVQIAYEKLAKRIRIIASKNASKLKNAA